MLVSAGEDCQIKLRSVPRDAPGGTGGDDAGSVTTGIKAQSTSIRTLSSVGKLLFSGGGKAMIKCWR